MGRNNQNEMKHIKRIKGEVPLYIEDSLTVSNIVV